MGMCKYFCYLIRTDESIISYQTRDIVAFVLLRIEDKIYPIYANILEIPRTAHEPYLPVSS